MDWPTAMAALQTFSIIVAVMVAMGTRRGRKNEEVTALAEMRVDIKYIKGSVEKLEPMAERLALAEASTKSAHKRLDEHIKGGE